MSHQEARGFSRQFISAKTRDALIQIASGDLDRPWLDMVEDWEELLNGIHGNGLLGLTARYLARANIAQAQPAFLYAIDDAVSVVNLHMVVMNAWMTSILTKLSAAGIDVLLLKGPALAATVYPTPSLRTYGDLDLMVREQDMVAAHAVLVDLGLSPEQDLSRIPPKLTPWCTTYEAQYIDPTSQFVLEMHYDDLLNAGLASRDIRGYWERAVTIDFHGVTVRALCPEDQLIHLCAHMHYHGYVKLIWFSDLVFLLRRRGEQFDWERVIGVTRAEEAQTPVYYSLLLLRHLLDVDVPQWILAALKPDRLRMRLHEYFLPMEQVRSLEPMARPDFSFYFLPLCKRLLPDLLTMGRRQDKLNYLLHLAVPPEAWLREYYGLDPEQRLAGYRWSHPLRILWHYASEIVNIPRSSGPWWDTGLIPAPSPDGKARPASGRTRAPHRLESWRSRAAIRRDGHA